MSEEDQEVSSSIQVIDRLTALMTGIAKAGGQSSLKWLSAETGLHPSTAHRILGSLLQNGWVERSPNGQYQFGRKLLSLTPYINTGLDIRRVALPIMEKLREKLGETVNLTIREGNDVVYVERVISQKTMRVEQVIGSRAPLHVTAVGKLFLGLAGEAEIEAYARGTGMVAYTENTICNAKAFSKLAMQAVKDGYAFDQEEAELGVGCIAVPIRDAQGKMIAGLSVSAPITRLNSQWKTDIMAAGLALSTRVGAKD